MFDYIYTGTETRDPTITDQLLQQYESYGIFRYFSNIRPDGGNLGGWVDVYSTRYVDRYAEELWDTLFAKAPEITLFNWAPMSETRPLEPGKREAWKNLPTSFNWDEMIRTYKPGAGDSAPPGWGRELLRVIRWRKSTRFWVSSGNPVSVSPAISPINPRVRISSIIYLGNIGIPIELKPE